jgi:hypothetical protein
MIVFSYQIAVTVSAVAAALRMKNVQFVEYQVQVALRP